MDVREVDVKTLAYIGDVVYELYIRKHVIENSHAQVNKLHKKTIQYVSAKAQAHLVEALEHEFTEEEKNIILQIGKKYNFDFNLEGKFTYDVVGCKECNNSGYYGRIGIYEVLNIEDNIKELIVNGASSIEVREEALKGAYKPLLIDGISKVISGITTLEEINKKLLIY